MRKVSGLILAATLMLASIGEWLFGRSGPSGSGSISAWRPQASVAVDSTRSNVSRSTSNGSQSIRRSAARSPCPRAASDMLDMC